MRIPPTLAAIILSISLTHADPAGLKLVRLATSDLGQAATSPAGETWKTTDGRVFQGVKVMKVEDDAVTILDNDGGARVPLDSLPTDLQQRFHYDPKKAQAAAAQYVAEQKASEQALAAEQKDEQAKQQELKAKIQLDMEQQQKEAAAQENEQAGADAIKQLKAVAASRAIAINGKVETVVPLGKGINGYIVGQQYVDINTPHGEWKTSQTVFVAGGVGQDFVTGDHFTSGTKKVPCDVGVFSPDGIKEVPVLWYYSGTYQYATTDGASVKCRIYSPSLEWAVRNLQDQSKIAQTNP